MRTLHTRPSNYIQTNSCTEYEYYNDATRELEEPFLSGFTPGKLADETQLGSLSDLISPNYNANESNRLDSPILNEIDETQPKSPKKRFNTPPNVGDIESVSRKIFDVDPVEPVEPFENLRNHAINSTQNLNERKLKRLYKTDSDDEKQGENMTQQQLIERIVDRTMSSELDNNDVELLDKPSRSCKGKRYAEFMTEGRLVGQKRTKLPKTYKKVKQKIDNNSNISGYNITLDYTIRKLYSRTNKHVDQPAESLRKRTISEASDDNPSNKKIFRAADFNLDEKIEALPSLSLEKFQQRKKENKKRKKIIHVQKLKIKVDEIKGNDKSLTGSRKRKARKESITHIDPVLKSPVENPDLFNLATLAEVAVNLAKP